MDTPVSLLERLQGGGDREAWSRLVRLYLPLLCRWARRAGLQDADAADLCQEVFAALLRALPAFRYDRAKSFRAWLRTVTLNKLRELRRRRSLPVAGGADCAELPAPADDPWGAEHDGYLAARALQLMKADFGEKTWRACWEVVAAGRDPAEVAAELGLSLASVYAARSRVLRRLRRELDGLW